MLPFSAMPGHAGGTGSLSGVAAWARPSRGSATRTFDPFETLRRFLVAGKAVVRAVSTATRELVLDSTGRDIGEELRRIWNAMVSRQQRMAFQRHWCVRLEPHCCLRCCAAAQRAAVKATVDGDADESRIRTPDTGRRSLYCIPSEFLTRPLTLGSNIVANARFDQVPPHGGLIRGLVCAPRLARCSHLSCA